MFVAISVIFILIISTDYRCEDDGYFPLSTSCVTISNPDTLSSGETWVNPEIRS
jgi:hypothetical protein